MFERRDGKSINNPHPDPIEEAERIAYVWNRKQEFPTPSNATIAAEMGCSSSTVYKLLQKGLRDNAPTGLEVERALAIDRAHRRLRLAEELWEQCGNDVELKMKLLERMAKLDRDIRALQGLDAAKKFDIRNRNTTELDADIEDLLTKFGGDMEEPERRADKRRAERRERFGR